MFVSLLGRLLGAVCLVTLLFVWGCRRENPSTFDSNLPPETIISGAPAESTLSFYQVHIYWYGQDPDGEVDHYEYAVTDTNKIPGEDTPGFDGFYRTTATDSTFKLTADLPQILGHRFYVRAIDNQGKMDPTPAWTYFVAHDFNFPNVEFHTSRGVWTDRSGNQREVRLTSSATGTPTDTIGVGGAVELSWGGFDVDPGGFVTGYEYRSSGVDGYLGGSLADTAYSLSFAKPAGTDLSKYFSGTDKVQVRAIDDAGAKTNPDSVRSFVVGFSPITWILDPTQPASLVRKRMFKDITDGNQNYWPSGVTLADPKSDLYGDSYRSILFFYTGFDDPRDMSLNPANPSGVISFEYRILKNKGGLAYLPITGWESYPTPSQFSGGKAAQLESADWLFIVRAVDELGRKGRPDTIAVNVNYAPYFTQVTYVDMNGQEHPLKNAVINLTQVDGEYPDVLIRYLASDLHFPPPDTNPADPQNVVEQENGVVKDYSPRLNGASVGFDNAPGDTIPGETYFRVEPEAPATQRRGVIGPGENIILLRTRDTSNRVGDLTLKFQVNLN